MPTQSYPFYAWALTKDYEPHKVELVGSASGSDGKHVTATGRRYSNPELHGCKTRAVLWARDRLAKQQKDLVERASQLERRKIELAKHADL
ncbi:hypothetical protein [Pseudomonas caspiana]|uniref:Uncharacterized protein n=1 Tax=Pseudomonas caspiana TaxID=1451454 RepID=A0A1Y3NVB8_9PSED|nr:hypothetical protein [Pseudomonas caspiana]OUM71487.1 hypothetical protein AUC60_22980 [Pseudomonas caspiana]